MASPSRAHYGHKSNPYPSPRMRCSSEHGAGIHTLVRDLKHRPQHLVLLLALVRGIFGVFHFVMELEERVFDVFEAVWWRLAVFGCADGGHGGELMV